MSIVAKKIMMGSGAVALPSDDQFNRVSFLSHFEGSNNGVNNAFDDASASNHTITANGNVTQGSFGPFARPDGEWGVALDGTASFLRATGAGDISGDFTLEAWVFMNSANGNYIHLTYNSGGLINVFNIYNGSAQNFLFGTSSTAGQTTLEFNDTTWDAGVWTHLAVVRSSGTLKIYVNGVADSTTSTAVSGNLTDLEYIGTGRGFTSSGQVFDGKVSNVRFSSTARYTSNFTPPTAPFTTDSDTNLLTCQSNRFVDNSSNGHTITPAGSAAVTAFGPFLSSKVYKAGTNGASVYMDGASDYLSLSASNDFDVADGDITIECWVYRSAADTTKQCVWEFYTDDNNLLRLFYEGNKKYSLLQRVSGTDNFNVSISGTTSLNEWSHLAVTRSSSGTYKLYINGVENISQAEGVTINTSGIAFYVGVDLYATDRFWNGYISDFRIVKGSLVYSSNNFTPPTTPLTAITNTKLLLNMADGQAIDSAAQNNITLAGNAKISTSVKKFGATSLFLDGGTSECFARYPQQGGGTGDFTIEFWIYGIFNNNQVKTIFDGRSSGDTSHFMLAQEVDNTWLVFDSAGGTAASGWDANTFSNNTWTHVAISRASGTTKYFIDGTQTASVSDTSNWVAGDFTIGGRYTPSSTSISHNGYIDDFRVSMMARYTSNFTPDTEPFADKGQ